jgi:hypothetical protein
MTNDEKRRLAVQHEIKRLRETVKSFDRVVADAQALAAEMRDAAERFTSIAVQDDIDSKIDRLDRLSGRGIYADAPAVCKTPGCNQPTAHGLGVCEFCNETGALDDLPAVTQYRVTTDRKNVYLVAAASPAAAIEKCDRLFPGERGMIVSQDSDPSMESCPHCGAPITPLGNCEDDCIYSNVVNLARGES